MPAYFKWHNLKGFLVVFFWSVFVMVQRKKKDKAIYAWF